MREIEIKSDARHIYFSFLTFNTSQLILLSATKSENDSVGQHFYFFSHLLQVLHELMCNFG